MPDGTTSNHFRAREALVTGLAERLFVKLIPSNERLVAEAAKPATRAQWVRFMVDLVERARAQPELHVVLRELRLEATRRPDLVPGLTDVVRRNLQFDPRFPHHDPPIGFR